MRRSAPAARGLIFRSPAFFKVPTETNYPGMAVVADKADLPAKLRSEGLFYFGLRHYRVSACGNQDRDLAVFHPGRVKIVQKGPEERLFWRGPRIVVYDDGELLFAFDKLGKAGAPIGLAMASATRREMDCSVFTGFSAATLTTSQPSGR